MKGQTFRLNSSRARHEAKRIIDLAPDGFVVNVQEPARTSEQNALMWALLSDISRAKPGGRVLTPDAWKCLFMAECGHQCEFQPSLNGDSVVPIGFKSSRLAKGEFSDLIESMFAFGAEHGVEFTQDKQAA